MKTWYLYESTFNSVVARPYQHKSWVSGVATGGLRGQSAPLDSEKFAKNWEKEGESQEKSGKRGKKSGKRWKNREGSFTFPLLTDRADYATVLSTP